MLQRTTLVRPVRTPSTGRLTIDWKGEHEREEEPIMSTVSTPGDAAIRPFQVDIDDDAILDLQRRVAAWRPPEREPVDDQSQGGAAGAWEEPELFANELRAAFQSLC